MTTDDTVLAAINRLADEEHQLHLQESRQAATPDDRQRMIDIETELDRCWDLLRQRRARRSTGQDPDDATVRGASTVEHYLQ